MDDKKEINTALIFRTFGRFGAFLDHFYETGHDTEKLSQSMWVEKLNGPFDGRFTAQRKRESYLELKLGK